MKKTLIMALATVLIGLSATLRAAAPPVDLGTAHDFAVLAGAGITFTGATTITGDIGSSPTPSITGLENVTLNGVNHGGDAATEQAKTDLSIAYNTAAGLPPGVTYAGGFDLVGLTLTPGVYRSDSSLFLSGTLTLDAQGDSQQYWVFQTGSTFITASSSKVVLIGGAQACNIFWQVGSSATLGTGTDFAGNILADQSITLNTGASVDGSALALFAAVTMDNNKLAICTVPEPRTLWFLGSGLVLILAMGAKKSRQKTRPSSAHSP